MKRNTLIGALLVSAVTLSAAGAVYARGGHGGPGDFGGMRGGHHGLFGPAMGRTVDFAELDTDGSGAITVADLEAAIAARFAEADANGDGVLDQAEIAARIAARIEERGLEPRRRGGVEWTPDMDQRQIDWMAEGVIIRMDDDKSGTVSAEEVSPDSDRLARMIDRFDSDGDDAVSLEEFEEARATMAERRDARGHGKRWMHRN